MKTRINAIPLSQCSTYRKYLDNEQFIVSGITGWLWLLGFTPVIMIMLSWIPEAL